MLGYSRVVREMSQREKKRKGIRKETEEEQISSDEDVEGNAELGAARDGVGGSTGGDSIDRVSVNPSLTSGCTGRKPPATMWTFGTIAGIQLLIFACGCPIGWEKFVSGWMLPFSPRR